MYSRSLGSGSDSAGSEYNERVDDTNLQTEWPQIRQALAKALGEIFHYYFCIIIFR
jgi:hypothetical protein